MKKRISEIDVARPVVEHLSSLKWDVHQEVAPWGGGSRRADIVAQQGKLLWVVEVKVTLSLAVIEQAIGWLPYAHYVSIATPQALTCRLKTKLVRDFGIGVYHVRPDESWSGLQVTEEARPQIGRSRLLRMLINPLAAALNDSTRTFAEAGNAENKYYTPFKGTCAEIRRVLARGPVTTKTLISSINHHYRTDSTAKSVLPRWLRKGAIPGVEAVPGSYPMLWRLKESA